jgi:pheromone shutdown protein TraB
MISKYIEKETTGRIMALLGTLIVIGALLLGCRAFALGVALAAFVAWLFYRWQMTAVSGQAGISLAF